ncbi:MAG: Stage III sporulation protein AC/AD protein family protein [Firmicutes bacterium ADurb.Bin193]|nr:MAG: Stage III sporulation protein AC/AD protein family protein [Firmicutes bacterium ADurb.Bin193]
MIIKIIALGLAGAIISVLLRQYKNEYSSAIAIAFCVIIFVLLKDDIAAVFDTLRSYIQRLGIDTEYIIILIKIIGIAYLTQLAASICEDAGEKAIAMKIEFAGRLTIILMSAPLMFAILNLITGILP